MPDNIILMLLLDKIDSDESNLTPFIYWVAIFSCNVEGLIHL